MHVQIVMHIGSLVLRFMTKDEVDPGPQLGRDRIGFQDSPHPQHELLGRLGDHPLRHPESEINFIDIGTGMGKIVSVAIPEKLRGAVELRDQLPVVQGRVIDAFKLIVHIGEQPFIEIEGVALQFVVMSREGVHPEQVIAHHARVRVEAAVHVGLLSELLWLYYTACILVKDHLKLFRVDGPDRLVEIPEIVLPLKELLIHGIPKVDDRPRKDVILRDIIEAPTSQIIDSNEELEIANPALLPVLHALTDTLDMLVSLLLGNTRMVDELRPVLLFFEREEVGQVGCEDLKRRELLQVLFLLRVADFGDIDGQSAAGH